MSPNIIVRENQTTNVSISFPGPCPYVYAKGFTPKCPYGHLDRVIPIVYGMPSPQMMDRADKGHIASGGCIISDCDPKYYCKIHEIEF